MNLYPKKSKKAYSGQKGTIINSRPEDCTLCGICQKKCPCGAIKVNKSDKEWTINHFSCIQCGYCVSSCPKKCIDMDTKRLQISPDKKTHIVKVNKTEKKEVSKKSSKISS